MAADASDNGYFSETVWQKSSYAFMRSVAKSVSYYLVSKKKQLIEISDLPCSEELKAKFTSTKTVFKTSKVEHLGHKIDQNGILHIPTANEPVFFLFMS